MYRINEELLPVDEATLRASLASYHAALEAHKTTEGVPAPWPEYEILREIVAAGGEFEVIPAPLPPEATPEELEAFALAQKREAALKALDDARLDAAMLDPLAPQEVKDYAAALDASKTDAL
jgi:hypothetical protein